METWEMIKELTENPNKKFYVVGSKHLIARVNFETNKIEFVNTSVKPPYIGIEPTIDWDWKEVKEPVSFIEAAKEVRMSNKRIKVRHKLYISGFMMLTDLLDEIVNEIGYEAGSIVVAKILTEGKFYIED